MCEISIIENELKHILFCMPRKVH